MSTWYSRFSLVWLWLVWGELLPLKNHIFQWYCWWKTSCTSWYGKSPIIYRVFYIPGGCLAFLNHQQYILVFKALPVVTTGITTWKKIPLRGACFEAQYACCNCGGGCFVFSSLFSNPSDAQAFPKHAVETQVSMDWSSSFSRAWNGILEISWWHTWDIMTLRYETPVKWRGLWSVFVGLSELICKGFCWFVGLQSVVQNSCPDTPSCFFWICSSCPTEGPCSSSLSFLRIVYSQKSRHGNYACIMPFK